MTTKSQQELIQQAIDEHAEKLRQRREAKQRLFSPQQLTDPRFMSRAQREAHAKGEEIWV